MGPGDYSRSDAFDPEMRMKTFGMGEPMQTDTYDGFVEAMRDWLRARERPIRITEARAALASG